MSQTPTEVNALRFAALGLSVVPVKPGSKTPSAEWKRLQSEIAGASEIPGLFHGQEIGIICGPVSGHLECLDFDDPDAYLEWADLIDEHGGAEIVDRCYVQETPSGGTHVVYRVGAGRVGGNKKLAVNEKNQVRIETRGEGGYFKVAPSPGYVPQSKNLKSLPVLTDDEHELFLATARFLSRKAAETVTGPIGPTRDGTSPGHLFNQQGNWFDLLEPAGWQHAGKAGERDLWVRPGKKRGDGISATTNHAGSDLLWIFSSNCYPFEPDKSYTKFGAYAILFHGGNFAEAAKELAAKGYEEPKPGQRGPAPKPAPVAPRAGLKLEVFGESFKPVEAKYLIDPYLRTGKAVLLDADGGTGKTSFAVALAAWVSRGTTNAFGEYCPSGPVRTLYLHKGEDESAEIETVYRANGGQPGMIAYAGADWALTPEGCRLLEETILEGQFQLVVLDALFYFLHDLPNSHTMMKDGLAVTKALSPLMQVYARTGATGLHIRHTSKGTLGKAATELGMGSQAFRNRHRGQLIMRYHPDQENYRGVVGIVDGKGSLLTQKGDSFFFRRVGLELQPILNIDGNPWEGSTGQSQGSTKQSQASEWLEAFVGDGVRYVRDIIREGEAAGFTKPLLYRAQEKLGLQRVSLGGSPCWACKGYGQDPDPFENAE